jgi:hypothetical protein
VSGATSWTEVIDVGVARAQLVSGEDVIEGNKIDAGFASRLLLHGVEE